MKQLVNAFRGNHRSAAILVALVALLLIAGCGGSDSTGSSVESSTVAATITKAELIKKGDAICRKTDAIQKSAFNSYNALNKKATATKKGEEEAIEKSALPPIGTEVQELGALGAPKGDEAKVKQILEAIERALKNAERTPGAVMSAIPDPLFGRVEELATKYGFKDCAKAL